MTTAAGGRASAMAGESGGDDDDGGASAMPGENGSDDGHDSSEAHARCVQCPGHGHRSEGPRMGTRGGMVDVQPWIREREQERSGVPGGHGWKGPWMACGYGWGEGTDPR